MQKSLTLIGIIIAGCLVAGLYGIIHDQLTYTISPEYYTKFKFYQFGLTDERTEAVFAFPRFQVSLVGFMSTWWVGVPIAFILGLFSLHSDRRTMVDIAIKGISVTILVAFFNGLYGLYWGYTYLANQPRENFGRRWFIPENLVDFPSFVAVGSMHNEGYIGAFYGLFVGIAYVGWRKGMMKMRQRKKASA
jgi:hypothetical protein